MFSLYIKTMISWFLIEAKLGVCVFKLLKCRYFAFLKKMLI